MNTRAQGPMGSLESLRVADIMVSPVRTVPPDLPVCELVRVLVAAQITGAPVVASGGALLGVVSASDVLRLLACGEEVAVGDPLWEPDPPMDPAAGDPDAVLRSLFEGSPSAEGPGTVDARLASREDVSVADIMTPALFTISPDSSLRELAGFLTRGRIHRSLVVEDGILKGIVTCSDIVSAMAGAVEEGGAG